MTIELIRQARERLEAVEVPSELHPDIGMFYRTLNVQLEILECGLEEQFDIVVVEHAELLAKAIMGVE